MKHPLWFILSLIFKLPPMLRLIVIIGLVLLFFLLFPIIRVVDNSMLPTYKDGQIVLGCRIFSKNRCKVGKVYIVHLMDEEDGSPYYIIKRLHKIHKSVNGSVMYDFRGDNSSVSYDSRQYGLFRSSQVEARLLFSRKKQTKEV